MTSEMHSRNETEETPDLSSLVERIAADNQEIGRLRTRLNQANKEADLLKGLVKLVESQRDEAQRQLAVVKAAAAQTKETQIDPQLVPSFIAIMHKHGPDKILPIIKEIRDLTHLPVSDTRDLAYNLRIALYPYWSSGTFKKPDWENDDETF